MRRILLVGNPNVGKSTLFNSITKSNVHTGNFHGVTVEESKKIININEEQIEFVDLPGLYSLNPFSSEEEISRNVIIKDEDEVFVLVDANSLRKNLYLCQQLNELGINYKILINNYDFYKKNKNKINLIDLKKALNKEIYIINAKKFKINEEILKKTEKINKKQPKYLNKYIKIIKNKYFLDEKTIIFALNGIFKNLNKEQIEFIKTLFPQIIKDRYFEIDTHLSTSLSVNENFIYGKSKLDKFLLNPCVAIVGFLLIAFLSFYSIFFLIGPFISSVEEKLLTTFLINPIMNFVCMTTDNIWIIEFVNSGILSSVLTVVSFVPQVCLVFVFLTILEDSGIISRLAYVFDDFLNFFGLNGKALYIMLLGFGCNTMSTTATRNVGDKNLKIKSALVNPYMSCMARLPVFVLIASAFFGRKSFLIIFGLYALGIVVAFGVSYILNKTILKTSTGELLLEFPPLKGIDIKHILKVGRVNAVDFFKRVFSVVFSVGVIVWILTHTQFNLSYTQDMSQSVLFFLSNKISFIFKPIGLNSEGIICALIVGLLAKELIVSTFAICNNSHTQKALISSLAVPTSVINFSMPSAVSFLIFALLYSSCASNLIALKKETSSFFMWFSIISQFTIAYMVSFIAYTLLTKGLIGAITTIAIIITICIAPMIIIKKIKHRKCLICGKCKN